MLLLLRLLEAAAAAALLLLFMLGFVGDCKLVFAAASLARRLTIILRPSTRAFSIRQMQAKQFMKLQYRRFPFSVGGGALAFLKFTFLCNFFNRGIVVL